MLVWVAAVSRSTGLGMDSSWGITEPSKKTPKKPQTMTEYVHWEKTNNTTPNEPKQDLFHVHDFSMLAIALPKKSN